MEFIQGLENFKYTYNTAVTIGKFDALHRGHRTLIDNVIAKKSDGLKSVAIIFSTSPRELLNENGEKLRFIITEEERKLMLKKMGIDYLLELRFDNETKNTEPEDFLAQMASNLNMKYLCVGEDFRFGHKGRGDVSLLQKASVSYGYELNAVKKLEYKGDIISSTRIRYEITKGNLSDVNNMLGYDFFIRHKVVQGNRIGRTIDYPTINLVPTINKLLPPFGVYATITKIGDTNVFGMTNIGIRPTVNDSKKNLTVETHLFDFNEDIYEKEVEVSFLMFLRNEKKFHSIEDLKMQIHLDEKEIRKWILEQKDLF